MTRDIFSAFFWLLILRLGLANGNPWYPWCWHVVVEFVVMGWLWCFSLEKSWDPPGDWIFFDGTETNNFWTPKGFTCIVFEDFQLNGLTKNTFSDMFRNYSWRKLVSPRLCFWFSKGTPPSFSHFPQWRRCDQRLERLCLESLHRTWMLGRRKLMILEGTPH